MQVLTFLFLCIVWGTTWIAIKVSLEGIPPFWGASIRFGVAIVFLGIYILGKRISLRMQPRLFTVLAISAFLMYVLDYGLIYWGEQYLSAGVTAIFFATFPLFTALWSKFLIRGKQFPPNKLLGLVLGFLGIFIVFYHQLVITQFSMVVILGTLAIIVGAAGGALSTVLVKKHLQKVNHLSLSFLQMLIGVVFLLLIGAVSEDISQVHLNQRVVFAVIYLGGVGSALAFAFYYWLLKTTTPVTLSLIIYITPIVAVIGDYFFYGQVLSLRAVLGMAVIFAGIAMSQMEYIPFLKLNRSTPVLRIDE